jgi:prepilin-type N-terminal cleavage/methylation domain-containing protein
MKSKARRKKSLSRGVTLIELLAVILIAGLLAAVSIPAFNGILKGTALRTAASSLTDTLSAARQFAITFRYLYHVEIDYDPTPTAAEAADKIDDSLQTGRFRIYFVDRDAQDPLNPRESEKITVRKWKLLPKFVEFESTPTPPATIVFKPNGGANAYDRFGKYIPGFKYKFRIIHMESGTKGKEKVMTISVNQITGKAGSVAG